MPMCRLSLESNNWTKNIKQYFPVLLPGFLPHFLQKLLQRILLEFLPTFLEEFSRVLPGISFNDFLGIAFRTSHGISPGVPSACSSRKFFWLEFLGGGGFFKLFTEFRSKQTDIKHGVSPVTSLNSFLPVLLPHVSRSFSRIILDFLRMCSSVISVKGLPRLFLVVDSGIFSCNSPEISFRYFPGNTPRVSTEIPIVNCLFFFSFRISLIVTFGISLKVSHGIPPS